jgi:hypothetical protein
MDPSNASGPADPTIGLQALQQQIELQAQALQQQSLQQSQALEKVLERLNGLQIALESAKTTKMEGILQGDTPIRSSMNSSNDPIDPNSSAAPAVPTVPPEPIGPTAGLIGAFNAIAVKELNKRVYSFPEGS